MSKEAEMIDLVRLGTKIKESVDKYGPSPSFGEEYLQRVSEFCGERIAAMVGRLSINHLLQLRLYQFARMLPSDFVATLKEDYGFTTADITTLIAHPECLHGKKGDIEVKVD